MSIVAVTEVEEGVLRVLADRIERPELGLPDPVFEFALRIVPMINVDLIVLDQTSRALWAWREDQYSTGWHIPGSIIRMDETIADRIAATARDEIGASVVAELVPRAIVQLLGMRGSFISMAHRCRLAAGETVKVMDANVRPTPGDLRWFEGMPAAIYSVHGYYRDILPVIVADQLLPPIMMTVRT